jgi:hypothetical protein
MTYPLFLDRTKRKRLRAFGVQWLSAALGGYVRAGCAAAGAA